MLGLEGEHLLRKRGQPTSCAQGAGPGPRAIIRWGGLLWFWNEDLETLSSKVEKNIKENIFVTWAGEQFHKQFRNINHRANYWCTWLYQDQEFLFNEGHQEWNYRGEYVYIFVLSTRKGWSRKSIVSSSPFTKGKESGGRKKADV